MSNPAIKAIKKALRVRRKMFYLARAKENAIRERAGYPPIKSWWENCWGGFLSVIRVTICRSFCPCFLVRWRWKSTLCPRTRCCGRCFYEGDYENEVLKNFLGHAFGALLTMLFYGWLCVQKNYSKFYAACISIVLGVVLTLGLSFAPTFRCLVFLSIPNLFSKSARSFLLVYATVLVFDNPAANLGTNLKVMTDSATCGQQLMLNETKQLMEMASDPLSAVLDSLKKMADTIKDFADALLDAFTALLRAVKEVIATVKAAMKWLINIVDICNDKMGEPYKKCEHSFDVAYDDCTDKLGWFLDWLCGIVSAASHLCNIARIGELLCVVVKAIKDVATSAMERENVKSITNMKDMFWFDIDIQQRFDYNITMSRSYKEVKKAIMKEINQALSGYSDFLDVMENVMMFTIIFVFIKAWKYRSAYLTKDGFDNYYVTQQMYTINERREKMKKEGIFPLKKREIFKYIPIFSILITKNEAMKMLKGIVLWIISSYNACFYLILDYGLFWLLAMVSKTMRIRTIAAVPPFMQLHVKGKGVLADMYKSMVGLVDPLADSGMDVDSTRCLPKPSAPNIKAYKLIVGIHLFVLFLVVFEAYGLRLRRAVAACYYPEREKQRAVWLYNTILFKRGSFFKFARRQIRRKYKDDKEIAEMSIKTRIIRQFPLLKWCVKLSGYDVKFCISCGAEGKSIDMNNFMHCVNHGCKAVYCTECYDELQNMCSVCMNPVDYGDESDQSEEMDSSEDEELKKMRIREGKQKRKEKDARIAKLDKKRNNPEIDVNQFKKLFDIPDSPDSEADPLLKGERDKRLMTKISEADPLLKGERDKRTKTKISEADPLLKGERDKRTKTKIKTKTNTNRSAIGLSSSDAEVTTGSFSSSSSSSSSLSDSEQEPDTSYQYANKSDLTTSTADETLSESECPLPGDCNTNSYYWRPFERWRPAPEYVTIGIFNWHSSESEYESESETELTVVSVSDVPGSGDSVTQSLSLSRSCGSYSEGTFDEYVV